MTLRVRLRSDAGSPGRHRRALVSRFNEAQSQLVVQTADLPLGTLAEMVENKSIDLEPGFQRRERWNTEKQSSLIESFLLNVPVPPIYLAEENNGTYTAIDGKQRLRAITEFLKGRLRLTGLERVVEAENLRFEDMPAEIVNALKLRPFLRVVTLLKQTSGLLKFEVFLRLNRGGEKLNNQEIRNVAFRGDLNDAIYELAKSEFFRQQLKIHDERSAAFQDMSDAEYVLRFLTLCPMWSNFSGRLSQEMDTFMEQNRFAPGLFIDKQRRLFSRAIERCEQLWGEYAFKRPDNDVWRDQLLAGMYDAQMIAVSELTRAEFDALVENTDRIARRTRALFKDAEFDKAVRTGTNTPARIKYRVTKMLDMLRTKQ